MEQKIKSLYILSIIAIIAFLAMQAYWLYGRYEFSLREYEERTQGIIEETLAKYDKLRLKYSPNTNRAIAQHMLHNLNTDTDSTGRRTRTATVTTKIFDGHQLLGINEKRELTIEEKHRLATLVADSIEYVETRKAAFDVSSAPSDGIAWNAMSNFDLELQSPFSVEGIDSLLRKENIKAKIKLIVTDSYIWQPVMTPHLSALKPHFTILAPYSELERKAVSIDCPIPTADVMKEMGWTLALAVILSVFLILCLIWQIRTIAKLTRLDKMRNSFITTMIHELKRPISTLKMCVSGFDNKRMMTDGEIRKELLAETRGALDSLSGYFSKLRDITFNDVEQIPLNLQNINLHQLFDNVASGIIIPSDKSASIMNEIDPETVVSADPVHLHNIITNLVENALKYSGSTVEIKATATGHNGRIEIQLTDTGNGISPGELRHIFQRFYRGKNSAGEQPGMGLGLAYVKLLTEAHGGSISVKSEEGVGTCFTISLPQ